MGKNLWLRTIVSGESKDIFDFIKFQLDTGYFDEKGYKELINKKEFVSESSKHKIILNGSVYIFENISNFLFPKGKHIPDIRHPQAMSYDGIGNEKLFLTSYFYEE